MIKTEKRNKNKFCEKNLDTLKIHKAGNQPADLEIFYLSVTLRLWASTK